MQHLDLFSGIGGFALAARWAGIETVGFCEIEEYPRKVLAKNFPGVTIHHDIRELDGNEYAGIDIITGGYPCQPFSTAGKRKGQADDRHLWPEMLRVITQARPVWVIAENVAGHITMGLDQVLADLESEGYTSRTVVIPACGVDAQHRRERVWIIANTNGELLREQSRGSCGAHRKSQALPSIDGKEQLVAGTMADSCGRRLGATGEREVQQQRGAKTVSTSETVADTEGGNVRRRDGIKIERQGEEPRESGRRDGGSWAPEPGVGRVAHGIPDRMDRIRGLGNAIVPQVAYQILKAINQQDSI